MNYPGSGFSSWRKTQRGGKHGAGVVFKIYYVVDTVNPNIEPKSKAH